MIRSIGPVFCAGGDIARFAVELENLPRTIDSLLALPNAAVLKLAALPVPIICALQGAVAGGGIGLGLCGDLILADESMKLRTGYSAIGLTPDAGSSWNLTRRADVVMAKRLFLLNQALSASECLAHGIVDSAHPAEELAEETAAIASRLAQAPAQSFARVKALVDGCHARTLAEQLAMEREIRDCISWDSRGARRDFSFHGEAHPQLSCAS